MASTKPPKLAKRYGKLTVVSRFTHNGRGMAKCKCTCGVTKDVRVNNLLTGVTKSCGAPQCRAVTRATKDKDYAPYGSRALSEPQIKKMVALYEDPKKRLSILKIAAKLKVNPNTAYSTMRAIRRSGGLTAYLSKTA